MKLQIQVPGRHARRMDPHRLKNANGRGAESRACRPLANEDRRRLLHDSDSLNDLSLSGLDPEEIDAGSHSLALRVGPVPRQGLIANAYVTAGRAQGKREVAP